MKVLFLIILSLSSLFASIGKVTGIKGEAYIERNNENIVAKVGLILEIKDKVITKDDSRALLLFNDNTSITIGKNSNVEVQKYIFDKTAISNSEAQFKFAKGVFRTITGNIGKLNKDKFKIQTSTATIGIRGTVFDVVVTDDATKIGVLEGGVFYIDEATKQQYNVDSGSILLYEYDEATGEGAVVVKEGTLVETEALNENTSEFQESQGSQNEDNQNESLNENSENNNAQADNESIDNNDNVANNQLDSLDTTVKNIDDTQKIAHEQDEVANNDDIDKDKDDQYDERYEEYFEYGFTKSQVDEAKQIADSLSPQELVDTLDLDSKLENDLNNQIDGISKEIMGEDINYIEYGYYYVNEDPFNLENIENLYIKGDITPSALVDYVINNANVNSATYSGSLYGIVSDNDGIKSASEGSVNLNVNFNAQSFTGDIKVDQGNWQAQINNGTVTNMGISSNDISTNIESSVQDISGNIDGKYYGNNLDFSIGGNINLQSDSAGEVKAVYGAQKQ